MILTTSYHGWSSTVFQCTGLLILHRFSDYVEYTEVFEPNILTILKSHMSGRLYYMTSSNDSSVPALYTQR